MKIDRRWPALLAALAVIALVATAAGCGGDDKKSGPGNATDAAFITDMTAHHQGAIDMAKLARTRAEHPQIRNLAGDIIAAQTGEIATMKRIRDDMGAMGMDHGDMATTGDGMGSMGAQGSGAMGMTATEMGMDMNMTSLERAKPFDRAFIDAMIRHHQGAITMARMQLAKGEQPALRSMARDIITAQTREIAQMRAWRKAWYGLT